jgi:hypothetical protein
MLKMKISSADLTALFAERLVGRDELGTAESAFEMREASSGDRETASPDLRLGEGLMPGRRANPLWEVFARRSATLSAPA